MEGPGDLELKWFDSRGCSTFSRLKELIQENLLQGQGVARPTFNLPVKRQVDLFSFGLVWSTQQVPVQLRLHGEILSQKRKKEGREREREEGRKGGWQACPTFGYPKKKDTMTHWC